MRGIQQPLIVLPRPSHPITPLESKGVVYTKRWVVDLLLDLSGYRAEVNLVDAIALEPAAGEGAFLGPMIERLIRSCRRLGRPLLDCRDSLIAYELDDHSANRARLLATGVLRELGAPDAQARDLAAWVRSGD